MGRRGLSMPPLSPQPESKSKRKSLVLQIIANKSRLDQESELGRRRVEQNKSSNERESVGENVGRSCFALTWATATGFD